MSTAAPRRGSFARQKGRSQPIDDTEEVRALRAKFSDRLEMIRELFPTWTDEDLLFALQDAGGDVETAVVRISEGQVEQFSSVKSKKQVKKETAPAPPINGSTTGFNSVAGSTPNTFARGRGGHVASDRGRGRGGAAVRGARAGRGGFRGAVGGRGGGIAPQVNGHAAKSPEFVGETAEQSFAPIATPTSGTSWADALSRSKSKQNGAQLAAAAPAAALQADGPIAAPALKEDATASSLADPVLTPHTEAASTIPATESFATVETTPAVKVPSTATPGVKPAMSWAQIARKSEAPKPVPVAPAAEPVAAVPEKAVEPAAGDDEVQNAVEQASWSVDEPQASAVEVQAEEQVSVSVPDATADLPAEASIAEPTAVMPAVEEVAEPIAEQPDAAAAAPFDAAEPAAAPTATAAAAAVPPGLAAAKPAQRAPISQRASHRSRQDAAVVMPGGSSQLDKLGVQFGNISFLGGEDEAAGQDEPAVEADPANVAPAQAEPAEAQTESPAAAKPQSSLHERLSQSQAVAAPVAQDVYASQQAQQQQPGSYTGFKSDTFDGSTYNFAAQHQQQQPQAHTQPALAVQEPVQAQQPAQHAQQHQHHHDHLSGYGGFNSLGQNHSLAAQQASQQPHQGLQDYSMYGGLDTQRLAHFYGGYDQSSNSFNQRGEDKNQTSQSASQQQQQPPQQQALEHQPSGQQQQQQQQQPHQQHQQSQAAAPGLHQQQQQQAPQQQFPGIMPYYYPHYYMPNQFQHYAQPTAGYGQYPMYGQPTAQPQHPSKPGTPANLASPYNQAGPQSADASAYGGQSHYGQTPSSGGLSGSYDAQGFSRGMQGMPGLGGVSDYSKIYGGAIPGLGGFLGGGSSAGAPPSQTSGSGGAGAAGTPHLGSQQKAGATSGSALDSYRQFDANAGKAPNQAGAAGQVNRSQAQVQSAPQQQQAQQHQQQQQYYHQYGAYGHQANTSASYGNYPYARQYWGQ